MLRRFDTLPTVECFDDERPMSLIVCRKTGRMEHNRGEVLLMRRVSLDENQNPPRLTREQRRKRRSRP